MFVATSERGSEKFESTLPLVDKQEVTIPKIENRIESVMIVEIYKYLCKVPVHHHKKEQSTVFR